MPQIEAKLSIKPLFERAIAALKEISAAYDDFKKKTSGATSGKSAVAAVGTDAEKSAKQAAELGQAVGKVNDAVKTAGSGAAAPFGGMRRGIQSVSEQLANARVQLLGFLGLQAGVQGVQQLATLADRYSGITARLRIATQGQGEFNQALATANGLAKRYSQPLAEAATLYTRVLSAVRPLGGGLREANVATEALLASLKISGATTAESASAVLQFSQALGAGALRGEEFNAIAEAAPRLLDALAAGLGKPKDQLKALAEQGLLTSSAIVQALAKELPRLRAEAARIPETIGSATQGVSNAMLRLVGATAEGSKGVAVIVNVLNLLAENLDKVLTVLTAVGIGFAALKLGVFVQGMVAAGSAAAGSVTGVAAFGLALRGALALITGPVGWIVALTAAAAAWLGLASAKGKAAERTQDVVRKELADAQAELELAEAQQKKPASGIGQIGVRLADAKALVKVRQDELDALRQQQAEEQELQRIQRRGNQTDLLSPKTVTDTEKDFETRFAVEKRFADKRAEYIIAKDKAIAKARRDGVVDSEVAKLQREKSGTLAELDHARAEELRKFDERGQANKVAQARENFNQTLELALDQISREKVLNQEAYDDKLRDLKSYLATRAKLEDDEARGRIDKLQRQLLEEEVAFALNEKRLAKAKPGNDKETLADAVAKNATKIREIQVEVTKAERDRNTQLGERERLERTITKELGLQREQVKFQLEDATGQNLSREQLLARAKAANRQTLEAFRQAGDTEGEEGLIKLINVQATQADLAQVERDFARLQSALGTREAGIQAEISAGTLTVADGERQILDLRKQQIPLLDAILERMAELATTPEDKQRLADLRVRLQLLKDVRTDVEKTLRTNAVDGLATALNDIVTGAKTVKEALLDAVASFAKSMLNVLEKKLAEKLVGQFLDAIDQMGRDEEGNSVNGGFFAVAAKFIAGLFHSGGIVGQGGAQRAVSPALFALAPRYHSGGIAGLQPGEVPAVLMQGEEVLTKDDPRHARNGGGRGGAGSLIENLNVTVQTDGVAQGDAAMANTVARGIRSVVENYVAEQMRPGGVLAGRR